MNPMILSYILALTPVIVKGIQTTIGDKAAGTTKAQIAHDIIGAAANGASAVLTGNNAVYGEVAAQVAQVGIDQTVAIAKGDGTYGKWTAIATAAQQDLNVAAAVAQLVKSMESKPVITSAPAHDAAVQVG